ncbi:PREDICTED: neurexin-4-like [Priapulus caudatus]|uniref:Neurexin-4-like n=1 Tax=Priapulus caudatus TaxID=37621 RepID=A0ABM1ETP8_PRICU|nr:PREDICTED: neurexin-4-like [Priapulus caudatus]
MASVFFLLLAAAASVAHGTDTPVSALASPAMVNCTQVVNYPAGFSPQAPLGCTELKQQIAEEVAQQLESLANASAKIGRCGTTCGPIRHSFRNCQEIKKAGFTENGLYYLDLDGPGHGRPPFEVNCDLATGTTAFTHDSSRDVVVKGKESPGSYVYNVSYEVPMHDIRAVMATAHKCEQWIQYKCYSAVLMKSSSTRYGWWASWDGRPQHYWGGAHPGSDQCACGAAGNCANNATTCNCDNNDAVWRVDNGMLRDIAALPVSAIVLGDTGDKAEIGYHYLSKLTCWHR